MKSIKNHINLRAFDNAQILINLERDDGYKNYADVFPNEFGMFLTKRKVDYSWDMDKQLKPFDDSDLQRFVKF